MESSVPLHGRTLLGDIFDEDVSELKFLKSKPTCFVVFGKPGSGKTSISKKLSEIWRCELIHGTDIVQREIDMGSPVGNKMQEMLMKGESLPTEFIIQLLKEKLSSPEVAHYGYVLDGLPSLSDEPNAAEQHMNIIENCQLKPDFVINIKIPDIDLLSRKNGLRVDCLTGETYLKNQWDPPPVPEQVQVTSSEEDEGGEEEMDEEEEEVEDNKRMELAKETKQRLIQIPEHQLELVHELNQQYKDILLKLIEEFIADHDRQYVIELDGNIPLLSMTEQLMGKLATYTARRAVLPIRLQASEEEELPDEIDTDELLRTLASYHMPGPRHRWRRSKWGRWCPVALKKGNMIQGKPDLAVGFLDKIYVMSSAEAMAEFLKNPRPFLLPPMPVAPCKLAVFGPPLSGKTTICRILSNSYQATVLDMKILMRGKLGEARQKMIEKAQQEATEQAVAMVKNKLEHEALERAEKRKNEAQEELVQDDGEQDAKTNDDIPVDEESVMESETSSIPIVTPNHEEVQQMVQEAVKKAENLEIKLPPEDYVEILQNAMKLMVEERLIKDKDAPKDGGWILDGFPENKDQWSAMLDAGVVPDDCIVLVDKSPNQEFISRRYFEANKHEISEIYRERLITEKQTALKDLEEELKKITVTSDITDDTDTIDDVDKDTKSEATSEASQVVSVKGREEEIKKLQLLEEISKLQTSDVGIPPHDSPEMGGFRESFRAFDKEWVQLLGSITGSGGKKPIEAEVGSVLPEAIGEKIVKQIEASFGYRPWNFTGVDLDEEEEDAGADDGHDEEEEDEKNLKNKKKSFGYSKHFDPVSLKNDFVLCPGNSDIAAKYREKVYFFTSTNNREKFLEDPINFLPKNKPLKPPPPRILILGVRGSGKSLQGRILAEKIGVFHISFRERLQEMILPKTKRKVGWEHEEDKLLEKEESVSVEEAVKNAVESVGDTLADDEQEEKLNLSDEEEAIRANLVDDEPLPVEVLEKVVPAWWQKEPYRSAGFILEGFPRTADECQFLLQSGLFPDTAILLMVDDNDVIKRLLPSKMKLWKKRREIKDEKKFRIKERKKEIRNEKIAMRRQELLNEQKEKRAALPEDEEEEEEEDIEEMLMAEFDEEEAEEEEEELEQDAIDRMRSEFGEHFDDDVNKLQVVQEQLEEGSVPRLEIQASRKPSIVSYLIQEKLKSLTQYRSSVFERPYAVSEAMANKLLLTGYKHPSSFCKWDPVKLHDGDVIQPLPDPLSYPVVYNQHVYFMSSLESRNRFMENPVDFAFEQPLAKLVVPVQVAVVGPPKSGKTTVCERLCQELGMLRISVGGCVRQILESQSDTHLASQILSFLQQGELLPDELAIEAMAVALLDTTCTTRGGRAEIQRYLIKLSSQVQKSAIKSFYQEQNIFKYALDGFPMTKKQMLLMSQRGIIPVKIIELRLDESEILHRAANEDLTLEMGEHPFHKSEDILMVKSSSYNLHIDEIRSYYEEQHQNWIVIEAKVSKWKLWRKVMEVTNSCVARIQDYLDRIARGEAACLANLCISPAEFESHLGSYFHYCPVSLNLRGELINCSGPAFFRWAVEYQSKYYKTSSKEDMVAFLASPEKFVPPKASRPLPPPHMLPKKRSKEEVKMLFPMQVDLNGYCPVSYRNGNLRFESLTEGNTNLAVEYCGRLYLMSTEERLEKFMSTPWLYSDLKLPEKLPPKKEPMQLTALPMLGYLEQGASTAITKALTAVGCFKPKFPFSSIKKSSLFYIACHLKGFNPRNSEFIRQKYQKKLKEFEETCKVITYLGNHMPSRYPSSLPAGFDQKMNLFLGLQNEHLSVDHVLLLSM